MLDEHPKAYSDTTEYKREKLRLRKKLCDDEKSPYLLWSTITVDYCTIWQEKVARRGDKQAREKDLWLRNGGELKFAYPNPEKEDKAGRELVKDLLERIEMIPMKQFVRLTPKQRGRQPTKAVYKEPLIDGVRPSTLHISRLHEGISHAKKHREKERLGMWTFVLLSRIVDTINATRLCGWIDLSTAPILPPHVYFQLSDKPPNICNCYRMLLIIVVYATFEPSPYDEKKVRWSECGRYLEACRFGDIMSVIEQHNLSVDATEFTDEFEELINLTDFGALLTNFGFNIVQRLDSPAVNNRGERFVIRMWNPLVIRTRPDWLPYLSPKLRSFVDYVNGKSIEMSIGRERIEGLEGTFFNNVAANEPDWGKMGKLPNIPLQHLLWLYLVNGVWYPTIKPPFERCVSPDTIHLRPDAPWYTRDQHYIMDPKYWVAELEEGWVDQDSGSGQKQARAKRRSSPKAGSEEDEEAEDEEPSDNEGRQKKRASARLKPSSGEHSSSSSDGSGSQSSDEAKGRKKKKKKKRRKSRGGGRSRSSGEEDEDGEPSDNEGRQKKQESCPVATRRARKRKRQRQRGGGNVVWKNGSNIHDDAVPQRFPSGGTPEDKEEWRSRELARLQRIAKDRLPPVVPFARPFAREKFPELARLEAIVKGELPPVWASAGENFLTTRRVKAPPETIEGASGDD